MNQSRRLKFPTLLAILFAMTQVQAGTLVRFDTVMGTFDIELFDDETPMTVQNFLAYVNAGDYTNVMFHRSVANFVIQGGEYIFDGTTQTEPRDYPTVTDRGRVRNEPVRSNVRGTIAMAKLSEGDDPENSATNQWFINVADNTDLDNQNGGFTAFGRVLGEGMTVVDAINDLSTFPFLSPWDEAPMRNYTINDFNSFTPINGDNVVIIRSITILDPDDIRPPQRGVVPWVVNNAGFQSRVAIFNNNENSTDVFVRAVSQTGEIADKIIPVSAHNVFATSAADLFGELTGYSLFLSSDLDNIYTSFLTFNVEEISGGSSPSQTTAAQSANLTAGLIFGYVPGDQLAAIVLNAPESTSVSTPVQLTLYGSSGDALATTEVTLVESQPLARLLTDLFPETTIPVDATLKAVASNGSQIAGTTFVFNDQRQPSMAQAFSFTP